MLKIDDMKYQIFLNHLNTKKWLAILMLNFKIATRNTFSTKELPAREVSLTPPPMPSVVIFYNTD